jgi:hypothetical protein
LSIVKKKRFDEKKKFSSRHLTKISTDIQDQSICLVFHQTGYDFKDFLLIRIRVCQSWVPTVRPSLVPEGIPTRSGKNRFSKIFSLVNLQKQNKESLLLFLADIMQNC